jgi:carbonic anhydrase/acetyltransferase-like protein (isoleucine patch superfamily)
MIHGCHIGAGSVVEPGAIVCDFSRLGAGSLVRAGAVVKQRSEFGDLAVVDGFPAKQVDTLATQPERPPWAFAPGTVSTLLRP